MTNRDETRIRMFENSHEDATWTKMIHETAREHNVTLARSAIETIKAYIAMGITDGKLMVY